MKKVRVVRANRGFWTDLMHERFDNYEMLYDGVISTDNIAKSRGHLLYRLSQLKIFDWLGIFQVTHIGITGYDLAFSYNRFINTKKPYVVAVETPLALVHYRNMRVQTYLGRLNLRKVFNKTGVRAICCISQVCCDTFRNYYNIPAHVKLYQIYPYIKHGISQLRLEEKINSNVVRCLFVASYFYKKGGSELLCAIDRSGAGNRDDIQFVIITETSQLNEETLQQLKRYQNVKIHDYSYLREELYQIYEQSNVLIYPTRLDSFGMVVLEAVRHGCAVLATDYYAVHEMIRDGYNGFLTRPSVSMYDENGMKKRLSKEERSAIDQVSADEQIVDFLSEKIRYFLDNREELAKMQRNSFELAESVFSPEKIKKQWEDLFDEISGAV